MYTHSRRPRRCKPNSWRRLPQLLCSRSKAPKYRTRQNRQRQHENKTQHRTAQDSTAPIPCKSFSSYKHPPRVLLDVPYTHNNERVESSFHETVTRGIQPKTKTKRLTLSPTPYDMSDAGAATIVPTGTGSQFAAHVQSNSTLQKPGNKKRTCSSRVNPVLQQ